MSSYFQENKVVRKFKYLGWIISEEASRTKKMMKKTIQRICRKTRYNFGREKRLLEMKYLDAISIWPLGDTLDCKLNILTAELQGKLEALKCDATKQL